MPSIRVMFSNKEILAQALTNDVYAVGRQQSCDIHIDNLGISRVHARFVRVGGGYQVEDLQSSNGTFVNGERVESPRPLGNGDQVTIGKYTILYADIAENIAQTLPQGVTPPSPAAPIAEPGLDDVFSTLSMDSDQIRKKMDEMKKMKEQLKNPHAAVTGEGKPAAASGQHKSASEVAEERAAAAAAAMRARSRKKMLVALGMAGIVILIAVLLFFAL